MSLTFAALGIDHRHIFGMAGNMQDVGATFKSWWTGGSPETEEGFLKRFPDVRRMADKDTILADPERSTSFSFPPSRAIAQRLPSRRWKPAKT
jgi:hypothetical protein